MAEIAGTITKTYRRRRGDPTYQDLVNFISVLVLRSGGTVLLSGEEMRHKKTGRFLGISGDMEQGYTLQVLEVPVVEKQDAERVGTG